MLSRVEVTLYMDDWFLNEPRLRKEGFLSPAQSYNVRLTYYLGWRIITPPKNIQKRPFDSQFYAGFFKFTLSRDLLVEFHLTLAFAPIKEIALCAMHAVSSTFSSPVLEHC